MKTQIHHNQTIWTVQGERKYLPIIKIKLLSNLSLELFTVTQYILFLHLHNVRPFYLLIRKMSKKLYFSCQEINKIWICLIPSKYLIYNCFKAVSYEELWYKWDLTYLEHCLFVLLEKSLDFHIILLCFLIICVNLESLLICISYMCWSSHVIFF